MTSRFSRNLYDRLISKVGCDIFITDLFRKYVPLSCCIPLAEGYNLFFECVYRFLLQLLAAVHRFRPEHAALWSVLTSQCQTATYWSSSGRTTTTHAAMASYTITSSPTGRLCTNTPSKQPVMTARRYFHGGLR